MRRYKYLVRAISETTNEIYNFDRINGASEQFEFLIECRDKYIEELIKTTLFKWVLLEICYYPKHIYYTIADKIADIKNKTNNDDGEYPF